MVYTVLIEDVLESTVLDLELAILVDEARFVSAQTAADLLHAEDFVFQGLDVDFFALAVGSAVPSSNTNKDFKLVSQALFLSKYPVKMSGTGEFVILCRLVLGK